MVDIQKLIDRILSDDKFATSGNFASRVYRDEPILLTASQMEGFTPSKYRAMRKIAGRHEYYPESEAKIFWEQGKFMEDFEDDFNYQGDFVRYFPTYQAMSNQQLRGYFSWRTQVRRGVINKTSLSYVFVYIYELINQIGVGTPLAGFRMLRDFWQTYKEIDHRIDGYVRMWLKDYVIYNNLEKSELIGLTDEEFDKSVLILLDYESYGAEEIFNALNSLSSYNLLNSRFYRKYPDEVKNVVREVYSQLFDHYGRKGKNSLIQKYFGKMYKGTYFLFKSAVFYDRKKHPDYIYEINQIHSYTCKNGLWSCERLFRYGDKNRQIGSLLKTIDFLMRRQYGFKSTLKTGQTTKILENIITGAIDKYRPKPTAMSRQEIEIDLSKLQNIREAALETQKKLIVDDYDDSDIPDLKPLKTEPRNGLDLSENEYSLMRSLLYGRAPGESLESKGRMLSVLVDSINQNLFELFGDTVITEADGRPELIEDYIDDLKEMIKE